MLENACARVGATPAKSRRNRIKKALLLAFRSFPAPDSGEGFRKHLARFYRFEERMRRFTGGDEGKKGHGFRGDGAFFFLAAVLFLTHPGRPQGFSFF